MKQLLFFFIFYNFSFAQLNMEIIDVIEYKINNENVVYKITAQSKIINVQNLKKSLFLLSKEDVVANNIFYTNGIFEAKDMKINFKKAYFLEGKFIMLDNIGNYKNSYFQSKKTIFTTEKLEFEDLFISIENKQYKKLKYNINLLTY